MDNFLEVDLDSYIFSKSLQIFQQINNTELNQKDIIIEKFPLSGISNTIYKVEIRYKQDIEDVDTIMLKDFPKEIPINHIFFKVFGRISVLVDRGLETFLMTKLSDNGLGPRIYETDLKTYRVEEFFEGFYTLNVDKMFEPIVIKKMMGNFSRLNILGGEIYYYADIIATKTKMEFFKFLKIEDKKTNIVNFSLKMKPLADKSFTQFKEMYENDPCKNESQCNWLEKIEHIEYTLNNLENILFDIFPEKGLFVIGHNDSHPLNILVNSDFSKVVLCDYEYSAYNFIGFDIVNYLIETCYFLSHEKFPFYQFYEEKLENLENDTGYKYFLDFFEIFEKENSEMIETHRNYNELIKVCKTKDYYYRLMGISSVLWFTFAVLYFDYDSIKNQTGYDYFNFSVDRLLIYDKIVKRRFV